MKFYNLALGSFCLIALTFNSNLSAQTCKVKIASSDTGAPVYTEVFEYDYVEEKPQFPGGGNALVNFINSNREYPHEAYDNGIEGRVTCSFIVNENGKISNIKVLRGVENSLNLEAMRVVSKMPDWTPGKINEVPVPVRVLCCIPFRK